MRLSLKRLIILLYLTICAFLSFINYRHNTSIDYDHPDQDQPSKSDFDHTRSQSISTDQPNSLAYHNRSGAWWLKFRHNFINDLLAILPNAIFIGRPNKLGGKAIDQERIDRALWPEETNASDRIVAQIELNWEKIKEWMKRNPDQMNRNLESDHEHTDQNDHSDHKKLISGADHQKLIINVTDNNQKSTTDYQNSKSILIYLPHGLRSWNVDGGRAEFARQQCRFSNCFLTDFKTDSNSADAVLFRNHFVGGFDRSSDDQIWIFYTLESAENTPSLIQFKNTINWTATFRYDSDLVTPYEKWKAYSSKEIRNSLENHQMNYARNKTKQVAWFVSNCLTSNRRQEYVQQLRQRIQVDVYGTCGPFKCSRNDPRCGRMLDEDYRFYLAFENSNCQDYITEKFFVQGLQHNIIPIVMGARKSDYTRVAPPHSFIHVDDFATPADLATYLHVLSRNDTLYNEYFKWKNTGEFINTKFWCRLCAMLNAPRRKYYQDIEHWWHRSGVCSRGKWSSHSGRISINRALYGNIVSAKNTSSV